jgi:hypothetical protein
MTVGTLRRTLTSLNMHEVPDLRPSLRIHAVILATLFCATLAFVAMDRTEQIAVRVFFALFGMVISIVLLYAYRKEAMLAHNHMVVAGTVAAIRTRPRGQRVIKYTFVALNGTEYIGKSDWGGRINIGAEIVVLYNPLEPTANQPLRRFLFYSFQTDTA